VPNTKPSNELEGAAPGGAAQEQIDWAVIAIAVPRDFKRRFAAQARRLGLKPSPYGRMILFEGLSRHERQDKAA